MTDASPEHLHSIRSYIPGEDVEWQSCEEVGGAELVRALEYYTAFEFNCAAKALALQHQLSVGAGECIYLDADMHLLGSLKRSLEIHPNALLLTQHTVQPFPDDGLHPSDFELAIAGQINGGFIGIRDTPVVGRALKWLRDHLLYECFQAPHLGMYVDQPWLSMLPFYFHSITEVVSDPALNIAYWNLHERELTVVEGELHVRRVGEEDWVRAILLHLSGLETADVPAFSRHTERAFDTTTMAALTPHLTTYRSALVAEQRRLKDEGHRPDRRFSRSSLGVRIELARRYSGRALPELPTPRGPLERAGRRADKILRIS